MRLIKQAVGGDGVSFNQPNIAGGDGQFSITANQEGITSFRDDALDDLPINRMRRNNDTTDSRNVMSRDFSRTYELTISQCRRHAVPLDAIKLEA